MITKVNRFVRSYSTTTDDISSVFHLLNGSLWYIVVCLNTEDSNDVIICEITEYFR